MCVNMVLFSVAVENLDDEGYKDDQYYKLDYHQIATPERGLEGGNVQGIFSILDFDLPVAMKQLYTFLPNYKI